MRQALSLVVVCTGLFGCHHEAEGFQSAKWGSARHDVEAFYPARKPCGGGLVDGQRCGFMTDFSLDDDVLAKGTATFWFRDDRFGMTIVSFDISVGMQDEAHHSLEALLTSKYGAPKEGKEEEHELLWETRETKIDLSYFGPITPSEQKKPDYYEVSIRYRHKGALSEHEGEQLKKL